METDDLKFNFLDNINCIVRTKSDVTDIELDAINLNKVPVLVYKPLYYRTYELLHIYLNSAKALNVGINLVDYFTKVKTFFIIINGQKTAESRRNDVYVIFNIDPEKVFLTNGQVGKYYIINENEDFISFGKFTMS